MIITLHQIVDANGHLIASEILDLTRSPQNQVPSPLDNKTPMDTIDFIAFLQANKNSLASAGYLQPSSIKVGGVNTHKWGVLVDACNGPNATPEAKALKLTL